MSAYLAEQRCCVLPGFGHLRPEVVLLVFFDQQPVLNGVFKAYLRSDPGAAE